jgi:hypothetical protein
MRRLVVSIVLLSVTACGNQNEDAVNSSAGATPLDSALTDSPNLLSRIRLSSTHAFEIYAVGLHSYAYSEIGTYAERPALRFKEEEMPEPAAMFQILAPGKIINRKLSEFLAGRISPAPAETVSMSSPDVEIQTSALGTSNQGGGSPGRCPFDPTFPIASGPLGPFCPTSGTYVWCQKNQNGWFFDGNSLSGHGRTRSALETACSNVGQTIMSVKVHVAGDPASIVSQDTFFIPAGFWRQWKVGMGCSQSCWYCPSRCENLTVQLLTKGTNLATDNFQVGGLWNIW